MPFDYTKLKKQAIKLRLGGLSYGNIADQLHISKSTASYWLHDIKLTLKQRKQLNANQASHLNTGPNSQRNRRAREIKKIIETAEKDISNKISFESYKLFGTALYWAEGSKKKMFYLTNSDPQLVLFWVKWLEKIFDIKPDYLKAQMNIYPQQSEKDIKSFWSDLTKIPVGNFGKSFVKPISKNYKKNNLYYGTIRIDVPKGTNYRYQVYAWQQKILKSIAPKIQLVERRWEKLRAIAKPINLS